MLIKLIEENEDEFNSENVITKIVFCKEKLILNIKNG